LLILVLYHLLHSNSGARTFFREFTSEKGLRFVLRPPRWGDVDDLLELHNGLIEEEAMIGGDSKRTRDQQVDSHA